MDTANVATKVKDEKSATKICYKVEKPYFVVRFLLYLNWVIGIRHFRNFQKILYVNQQIKDIFSHIDV